MATLSTTPPATERARGRGYFWAGIGVALLGLALAVAQFVVVKYLAVPWYSPALATLGALLLLVSLARRRTVPRLLALVLVAALAAYQWYFLGALMKLPDYAGPARGRQLPAFRSVRADGQAFTEADLSPRDGSRRAMVFFRGRW